MTYVVLITYTNIKNNNIYSIISSYYIPEEWVGTQPTSPSLDRYPRKVQDHNVPPSKISQ